MGIEQFPTDFVYNYDSFKGINNKQHPLTLEPGTFLSAKNADVTDNGRLRTAEGFTQVASFTRITGAFATRDKMYLVDDGTLYAVDSAGSAVAILSGVPNGELYWREVGPDVIVTGVIQGILRQNEFRSLVVAMPTTPAVTIEAGSLPAGQYQVSCVYERTSDRLQSGAPAPRVIDVAEGSALRLERAAPSGYKTWFYVSPPDGGKLYRIGSGDSITWNGPLETLAYELEHPQIYPFPDVEGPGEVHEGRLVASGYFPAQRLSVIYRSQPYAYHLFDIANDYDFVEGEVTMLASTASGLIIGTDQRIYAEVDGTLGQVADYGVPKGQNFDRLEDRSVVFWTERGVCVGLPFQNLTDAAVSVVPGARCAVKVLDQNGMRQFLVVTDNIGNAYNPYGS